MLWNVSYTLFNTPDNDIISTIIETSSIYNILYVASCLETTSPSSLECKMYSVKPVI